jgi:hypothetical protein
MPLQMDALWMLKRKMVDEFILLPLLPRLEDV